MSLIRLENIVKSLGGKPILSNISFRVEEGEKIGLIGRNGTGKTTVFRLIAGEMSPDSGTVERMRKARMACLSQMPDVGANDTIFDTVLASFHELLAMEHELTALEQRLSDDESLLRQYGELQDEFTLKGGYEFRTKARRVLHGLGFSTHEFDLRVHALSGGQRTRLMLALVLLQDADLLLLDEPENHLDIEAREWLEVYLRESPKSVVIISHDRRMLNHVVKRVVEVERAELRNFAGGYDAYLDQKVVLRAQQQKAFNQEQAFIEKEQRWIERFRYKNTKARQVQSRAKRLEKLDRTEAPPPESSEARIRFGEVVRSGQLVLNARNLAMAYGDLKLYDDLSFEVTRGERVGIIGPNGSGKTTLLRHLAGRLTDAHGAINLGHKVEVGFYEQQQENLVRTNDILTEIRLVRPDMTPEQVRTFMGGLLFTGDDVFKPLSTLSGGELSRVALARLILGGANLLFLDEPTNHLDIASREALEMALDSFPGTILMVSHDRELIDRLVDKLIIIEDGRGTVHLGNYTHYRWKLEETAQTLEPKKDVDILKIRNAQSEQKKRVDREEKKRRKQIEELESNIESVEQLISDLEAQFVTLDPADYERARTLKEEYDGLKSDLQALYEEWEELVS